MSADPSDPSIVSIVPSSGVDSRGCANGKPGPGRPKGTSNKHTTMMRFMLEQIVAGQLHNVDKALNDTLHGTPELRDAMDPRVIIKRAVPPNPKAYLDAMVGIVDFTLPRLTRVEVKDDRAPPAEDLPEGATLEDAERAYMGLVKIA